MLLAFSVAPMVSDDSGSVAEAVAAAVQVVRDSGLPHHLDAMFTTVEGEWDEVMAVVKAATDAVLEYIPAGDPQRVSLVMKADIRPGYSAQLTQKIERVEAVLRSQ